MIGISRSRCLTITAFFALLVPIAVGGGAEVWKRFDLEKPGPDVSDLRYGPFAAMCWIFGRLPGRLYIPPQPQ